jgi:hypothetical protein
MRIPQTNAQRATNALLQMIQAQIKKDYIHSLKDKEAPLRNFEYEYSEGRSQIWCYYNLSETEDSRTSDCHDLIYAWWDGREVTTYDDADSTYLDFLNYKRRREAVRLTLYSTSPLIISAIIAVILVALIAYMLLSGIKVPDPLWSIFTAVVAFYFGRESSHRGAGATEVATDTD